MSTLLSIVDLDKRLGGLPVTDRVSMSVETGEFHAIIGPNGAGKSTLVNQIGGQLSPDSGAVRFAGSDITMLPPPARARLGIARVFQVPRLFASFAAVDNPAIALLGLASNLFGFWKPLRASHDLTREARQALASVGIEDRARQKAGELSHGDRRLLEMAIALASRPKLLLLDEPMAGLGRDESLRMAKLLGSFKGAMTIVMVEHDMDTVFSLADRVTVLASGRVIAAGPPQAVRADAAVRASYLGEE